MTENKVVLDTAAFLDSDASRALTSVARKDQQAILERFLRCVYEDTGKAPEHLDGDDVHSILGHLMPAHFERKDPLAAQVKPVLVAYFDHLEEHAYVPQLPQLRLALEWTAEEFEETVRTGKSEHHAAPPVRPIVNRAPKVGRNEPCPCGSGKKFKKCCAKLGS